MRTDRLVIIALLLCCSCRFIVDPEKFRDDDPGDAAVSDTLIGADTLVGDGSTFNCGTWQPRFIDIDLTQAPPTALTLTEGSYSLDASIPALQKLGSTDTIQLQRVSQRDGEEALLLWGQSLFITGVTITAQGSEPTPPLLFAARSTINVNGTIDVSSSHSNIAGAGADPDACTSGGEPRQAGFDAATSNDVSVGGGGGGGGFGWAGANGGQVDDFGGTLGLGGNASVSTPSFVRGGCPGGTGASGISSTTTQGGRGGGAIHLISCDTIAISGKIHASGGGGLGGSGNEKSGGGGGGSGGYIGMEAPTVQIAENAVLAANGGGGGGGGGGSMSRDGDPGTDGALGVLPADGGVQVVTGGGGGAGDLEPSTGNPTSSGAQAGAGGGGGGQGVILVISSGADLHPSAEVSPGAITEPLN